MKLAEAVFVSILYMESCAIQESYCFKVCIEAQAQCTQHAYFQYNKVVFRVVICRTVGKGQGQGKANPSFEGESEVLD